MLFGNKQGTNNLGPFWVHSHCSFVHSSQTMSFSWVVLVASISVASVSVTMYSDSSNHRELQGAIIYGRPPPFCGSDWARLN